MVEEGNTRVFTFSKNKEVAPLPNSSHVTKQTKLARKTLQTPNPLAGRICMYNMVSDGQQRCVAQGQLHKEPYQMVMGC